MVEGFMFAQSVYTFPYQYALDAYAAEGGGCRGEHYRLDNQWHKVSAADNPKAALVLLKRLKQGRIALDDNHSFRCRQMWIKNWTRLNIPTAMQKIYINTNT
jgi:hypothetical protein